MQDTVSFGKYDKENYNFVSKCVIRKLCCYKGNSEYKRSFKDSKYLKLAPAKDTLLDQKR